MKLGVCYYPEHWPPHRWPIDAKLFRAAGLTIARLGEFAWQQMEPVEGEFTWGWLDRAIEVFAGEDFQLILGTPTATPPAWLCKQHPDILPVDAQGRRRHFGSRRHYCSNNPNYHTHTRRIVSEMAKRYGQHPAVIGWQIDNEFGCHDTARCYCDVCAAHFRSWLKTKYQDLDALNHAWGTAFWSQGYGDWSEIDPPYLTVTEPNPSHVLDYYRFSSDSVTAYQHLQLSILRSTVAAHQRITTNFMGNFPDLNYHDLARPLDWVTWDSYPTGYAEVQADLCYSPADIRPTFAYDVGDPYITGFCHDLTRGLKQAPFWVMEQQCGNVNWSHYNANARPGTVRLWTWHALASGAEAVVYFRDRAVLYAQEQQHSGLLHHDGSPAVGYHDAVRVKAELGRMAEIAKGQVFAEVALLLDYNDLWALQLQPHRRDFGYLRHLFVYYQALQRLGLPCDIVPADADLSKYKLVIAPTAFLASEPLAHKLTAYAQAGGAVLFGVRSGFKTPANLVTDQPLPGLFGDLVGATVTDWTSLPPGISFGLNSPIFAPDDFATTWIESLTTANQPLATYASGPYVGQAAMTQNQVKQGAAFYLGFYPTVDQAKNILKYLAQKFSLTSLASDLPAGLVVGRRGSTTLLLNFTDQPLAVIIKGTIVIVDPRDISLVS
jgi:beta-galactosidase